MPTYQDWTQAELQANLDSTQIDQDAKDAILAYLQSLDVFTTGDNAAAVELTGTADPNDPTSGKDIFWLDATAQTIDGATAPVIVATNSGNDSITVDGSSDYLIVTSSGNDQVNLEGASGADTLYTSDGNDTIWAGGAGPQTVYSGAGDDAIYINNGGESTIYTGTGQDYVSIAAGTNEVYSDGSGFYALSGGSNLLNVSDATILASGGASTIAGSDLFVNSTGSESLNITTSGNDNFIYLNGTESGVTISGGGTSDHVQINSTLPGSWNLSGIEYLQYQDTAGGWDLQWTGTSGADEFHTSTAGLTGSTLYGGEGNDSIWLSEPGDTTVYGGDGNDAFYVYDGSNLINTDGANDSATAGTAPGNNFVQLEGGANTIYASGNSDLINAYGGSNEIHLGDGAYTVDASNTLSSFVTDTIYGGSGSNVYNAGSGEFSIIGGTGDNTYNINSQYGSLTIDGSTSSADYLNFTNYASTDATISTSGGTTTYSFGGGYDATTNPTGLTVTVTNVDTSGQDSVTWGH
jgi:Ca2+-binding RTX toxin-like protein